MLHFNLPSLSTATIFPEDVQAGIITLQDTTTGNKISVPEHVYEQKNEQTLRRRIFSSQPMSERSQLIMDWSNRSYRLTEYPPLTYAISRWYWYIPFGILLIAACAQIKFLFPCVVGYTEVTRGTTSYCVDNDHLSEVTATLCPTSICAKRVPVTMQTFAVLLNGALAGSRIGALTSFFYLVLVCLGAPFSTSGTVDPVWEKGGILSSTGGFLWGFIAASYIMGRCTEKGHDRQRSMLRLILWMFLAEGVMYIFGLTWLPFGLAIKAGKSPSAICPSDAGAAACLKNIFSWGFVPFIPGDLFKMFLVLLVLPISWKIMDWYHKRSHGYSVYMDNNNPEDNDNQQIQMENNEQQINVHQEGN